MGLLVKRRVTLDLARRGTQATVPFSLGDRCAYEVIFTLRDGSEQVALPTGTSAAVTVRNGAGGTGCVDGCVIDHVNNNVIYTPTVDALSVEGNIECTLHLFDGDGGVIGAPTFIFVVSEGDKADTEGEVSKALVANPGWGIIADTENKAKEAAEAAALAGNFAGQAGEEVAAAQAEAEEARAEADRAHAEAELSKMWANGGILEDQPPSEINNSYYWAMVAAGERMSAETQVELAAAEVNKAKTEVQNAAAEVEKAKAEAQTAEAEAIKARMWAVGEKNTPGKTSPSDSNNAMYYSNKSRDYMNEAEKYTNMTLSLSVDREKHIYTVSLIRDGTVIGNPIEIDLPFEEVVVGGEYDDTSEELVLDLKGGSTVRIPVGDIISPDDVVRRMYHGSYDAVYTETSSGTVALIPVKVYSGEGAENTLVKRGSLGEIRVRSNPELDDEAVPKRHVDEVADAFGKALEDLEERVTQNQPAPVEIVQNLGDSPTAVIAQKGVTDAIDGLALKGSASGKVIRVDDVALGEYPVKVIVTGVGDPSSVKVTRYGATTSDSSQTYTPNADGTVDGVLSLYPVMHLVTDNTAAILDVEYSRDINAALEDSISDVKLSVIGGERTTRLSDTELTEGYVDQNGTSHTTKYYRCGYIDVSGAEIVTVDTTAISDTTVINFVDASKNHVSNYLRWGAAGLYEITIPEGVSYLQISCISGDASKIVATYKVEGCVTKVDKVEKDIEAVKTDMDKAVTKPFLLGGESETKFADVEPTAGWMNWVGDIADSTEMVYGFIDISNAKTLVIEMVEMTDTAVVNFADANKAFLKNEFNWKGSGTYDVTYIPDNTKYLVISCRTADIGRISVKITYKSIPEEIATNREDTTRHDAAYAYTRTRGARFIKGLHLDCGRKYFSVANIKTLLDEMHAANLNTFQIYFSDHNGFRFGLDDMNVEVNGATYDVSVALGDGYAPTDGSGKWLTQAEMDDIIAYAEAYDIEVIPAFDMPGHFGAIRDKFNEDKFKETTEHGRTFMCELLKKYASYFASKGCRYFNICGDETTISSEVYEQFMSRALYEIAKQNLTPLFYNDSVCKDGYLSPYLNNGSIVLGWTRRGKQAAYSTIDRCGYRMINAYSYPFYWVLNENEKAADLIDRIRNWDIFEMADGSKMYNIVGAMYHIWCDVASLHGADEGDQIVAETAECIAAFGEAVNRAVPRDYLQTITSPDGSVFRLDVADDGTLSATRL